jgi:hypothetical protein
MPKPEETYIVKPKQILELIATNSPSGWNEFLANPPAVIVEALTGFFADGNYLAIAAGAGGHILQAALQGRMLKQFAEEFRVLRKKGKIKDPSERPSGFNSWVDLLKAVDSDMPDEEKFEALKAMFFTANSVNATDAESMLAYQLLQIAKRLNSGELMLLRTNYRVFKKGQYLRDRGEMPIQAWTGLMRNELGQPPNSLIELHEKALVENQLISPRIHGNQWSVSTENCRLTDLGIKFCENIETYRATKEEIGL